MHKFVFHNDRILPLNEVRLSPGQAGLLNGWGIFTTLRIYDGQPFAFERHWKRLSKDARFIQLPLDFSPAFVLGRLRELLAANAVKEGCVRVYFLYNKIGFWCSDEPFPVTDFLMYTTDLPSRVGPTQLAVQAHGRHAANPLTGAKVTSWLQNVWSLEQAHQRGFEEVLMLNERGEVTECTAANVFSVRGGRVATPPLSSGCLAGVSRETLLELGPEIGLPITEKTLTLDDLHQADEVFLSSTTRQVQPVRQIEDHNVPLAPGPVTERFAQAFSDCVARYFAQRASGAPGALQALSGGKSNAVK